MQSRRIARFPVAFTFHQSSTALTLESAIVIAYCRSLRFILSLNTLVSSPDGFVAVFFSWFAECIIIDTVPNSALFQPLPTVDQRTLMSIIACQAYFLMANEISKAYS